MRRLLTSLAVSAAALAVFVPAPAAVAFECEHYYVDPTPGSDPYVFEEHYECATCPIAPRTSIQGDRIHIYRCKPSIT